MPKINIKNEKLPEEISFSISPSSSWTSVGSEYCSLWLVDFTLKLNLVELRRLGRISFGAKM
jgi:hypothetical protein